MIRYYQLLLFRKELSRLTIKELIHNVSLLMMGRPMIIIRKNYPGNISIQDAVAAIHNELAIRRG